MNPKPDWKEMLLRLPTPPVEEPVRERSLRRALAALNRTEPEVERSPAWNPRWIYATGLVLACSSVAALFLLKSPAPSQPAAPAHLFAEMEQLFHGELEAVIVDNGKVDVTLSDTPEVMPPDQRVCVQLQRGSETVSVLTYSGQRVCLNVDGNHLCLTPLLTGENTVFVLTDHDAVLPNSNAKLAGFRVSTTHLGANSL